MSFWEDIAIRRGLRPRVAHRLPGRLRLHIPLLGELPETRLDVAEVLEDILASPEGVRRVRAERRTGSLLIEYDAGMLEEADVRRFVESLLELLRRHRRKLSELRDGRAARVAAQLEAWIREHTRRRPVIDPRADIPDEVWT